MENIRGSRGCSRLPGTQEGPVVISVVEVAQAAAQDPVRAALGLCFFFVSLLQKGRLRLIHSGVQQMDVKKKTGGHGQSWEGKGPLPTGRSEKVSRNPWHLR